MKRSRRLFIVLTVLVPALAIVVGAIIFVRVQMQRVLRNADVIIVDELTRRLDREVRIDGARVDPLGVVVLKNVQIASGRWLKDGKLVTAREVRVRFDPRSLLMRNKGAQSVRSAVIIDPILNLVRRRDGSLNIQDLLKKPSGPAGPPFEGSVQVKNGTVRFTDYLSKTGRGPEVTRVNGLQGYLDAGGQPTYSFWMLAKGSGGKLGRARVAGEYDAKRKITTLDLSAGDVSAAYWSRYFGIAGFMKIRSGSLDVSAGVRVRSTSKKSHISLTGAARVNKASVLLGIANKPVEQLSGSLALAGEKIILNLQGNISGSPIHATGGINKFTNPALSLSVSSPNADWVGLMTALKVPESVRQIHPSGRGPINVTISGRSSAPVVDVTARVPKVSARGYTATDARLSMKYSHGLLAMRSLQANWRGAKVVASGTITTQGNPVIDIKGRAAGVKLANLPLPHDFAATGTASLRFTGAGPIAAPRIRAHVRVRGGEFRGIAFDSASGRVSYAGGNLQVNGLDIRSSVTGRLVIRGSASPKKLNLSISGESVDLAKVGKFAGVTGIQGRGFFSGQVMGNVSAPVYSGVMEVFAARYRGYRVDYARLRFVTDLNTARVTDAVVRMFPAELKFRASAGGLNTDRVSYRVAGRVERLTVGELGHLIGRNINASGTLVGDFQATGAYLPQATNGRSPLADMSASADLRIQDGTAFGYPINNATARLTMDGPKLLVKQAELTSLDAKATVSGSVDVDNKSVALALTLTDLNLARLRDKIGDYAEVGGTAGALGTVTGSWDNPKVVLNAGVEDFDVNHYRFSSTKFDLVYADNVLDSFNAVLRRGDQSYNVQVNGYNLNTNTVKVAKGTIKNASIPQVWSMLAESPYVDTDAASEARQTMKRIPRITSGTADVSFDLSGSIERPTGSITVRASDIGLDKHRIESVALDATSADGVLKVDQLKALSGDTSFTVAGNYTFDTKQVQLDAAASNVDLTKLRPWLGDNTPGGIMAADFVVQGNVSSPHVIGSVEVVKPSMHGFVLDALRASRIEVTQDKIEVADVILASGNHQAVAQGYIPWDWSEFTIPSNRPLELTARLNKQDLSLLTVFSSQFDPARTRGEVEGQLRMAGTVSEPQLSGSLKVDNGAIAIKGFINSFDKVGVDLAFNGDRVIVNKLSAQSSMGGSIGVVPGGYISMGDRTAHMQVAADGLIIAERDALGFREDVNMRIDAGLAVTGDLASPLVANAATSGIPGGVNISDATLSFVVPENMPKPQAKPLSVNPRFDVGIKLGKDVVVSPPSMSLVVGGNGLLNGTLEKPDLVFDLAAQQGSVRLATSRLRVTPGGKIYMRYAPPSPMELRVDFQATTTVTATGLLGRPQRYVITLGATGPVSDMQVDLSSSPADLSREQMLAALGHMPGILTGGEAALQKELGNILTAVGTSTLFAPVENLFVEKLGFEQFSLEYGPGLPLALYVSRKLIGNTYMSYYGRLKSDFTKVNDVAYQLGLGYKLGRNYDFNIQVDNQETATFQVQYSLSFK
ncbi:MAG: translocation/assembly module TamB domain-containing protein [Armatimonadota bacterium]|nr:translocation/assembly module TamB domain-containing protein [bacterium]